MRRQMLLTVAVAAALAMGCSSEEPETVGSLSDTEQAVLRVADAAALRAMVAEHKGKVVVLTAWSVRQEGCVELYRELGSLCAGNEKTRPVVIAVNLDGVDDVREKVLPLVRAQQPGVVNRVFEGSPMDMTTVVPSGWGGLLPAVWVVRDREGDRASLFCGKGALGKAKAKLKSLQARPH